MAEALVNHLKGDTWEAYSAGTHPSGYVHPLAIRALLEMDVPINRLLSKTPDALQHIKFDRVYTVCSNAAEDCPIWLREGAVLHMPFDDPADANGSVEEIFSVFKRVRDEIKAQIVEKL
jgi:arsenate reductase